MQTTLADFLKGTRDGAEAEAIVRACVHCGFCTATCPTYQLLGDELDGSPDLGAWRSTLVMAARLSDVPRQLRKAPSAITWSRPDS